MDQWDNVEVVSERLGVKATAVTTEIMDAAGNGLTQMTRLTVNLAPEGDKESETRRYVLKITKSHANSITKQLGLTREVTFYREFAKESSLKGLAPQVFFTYVDAVKGEKAIVMEDIIGGVQSGYYFGHHNPHNDGRDLEAEMAKIPVRLTESDVAHRAVALAARAQAPHWNDRSLLARDELNCALWLRGEAQESWQGSLDRAQGGWTKCKAMLAEAESPLKFTPRMIELLDASFAKISFPAYIEERSKHFTLAHGDFHPANFLVRPTGDLVLLDWEVIGVGSGPQDIGQFFLSHSAPEARRAYQDSAIRCYYDTLVETRKSLFPTSDTVVLPTFEEVRNEVFQGGFARFTWMLPICVDLLPAKFLQFFHDQMLALADDGGITVENVGMPRP